MRHPKTNALSALALVAIAAFTSGCDPHFTALTVPPPTAEATLSDTDRTIDLSKGVAMAFECVASDGSPCDSASATADDPAILGVFNGYVDLLSPSTSTGYSRSIGAEPRVIFVVLGRAEGSTTLHITSGDGDVDFNVSVAAR